MAQVTMKDLSAIIAIGEVEEKARQKWEQTQRRRRSIHHWMVRTIPLQLLIMLAVFYALSAPHTAELLNKITPGVGWLAPVGFELGVLIVAALREAGWKNTLTKNILFLLLGMSILINCAGGFIAVIMSGGDIQLEQATFQSLIGRFAVLPAASQIVLLLVVPLGILIPIMSKFAGEALIKFSMGRIQLTAQSDEDAWIAQRRKVLQQALYAEAVKAGAGAITAGNWSQAMVLHWYREIREHPEAAYANVRATSQQALDLMPDDAALVRSEMGFAPIADGRTGGHYGNQVQDEQNSVAGSVRNVPLSANNGRTDSGRKRDAREITREYIREHPEAAYANVRQLAELLGVGKTTVSAVQREFRK